MMKPYPLLCLLLLCACQRSAPAEYALELQILPAAPFTRSAAPEDEQRISDCNILVYNCFGMLEDQFYSSWRETDNHLRYNTQLLKGAPFTILAAANLGYRLPAPPTLEEAVHLRHYLAFPDEYSLGLPMAVRLDGCLPNQEGPLEVRLERLMARIDLEIDRTALDADVRFTVQAVRVGGCPSSVLLFGPSAVETAAGVFTEGFVLDGAAAAVLNRDVTLGHSQTASLYLLENRQGDLLEHVETDAGKVFTDGRYREVCSYVEIQAEYHSDSWDSRAGEPLIYRFYLGENRNNFDVRRNCVYRITVRPEGDGLREDSWRVDKEGLVPRRRLQLYPAAYNECQPGEDFHIWCEVFPRGTPMTIEPLAWDDDERVEALYDYTLDADGNGITLHTKKGGSALVYFRAGPPVDRDTLAMLVIAP